MTNDELEKRKAEWPEGMMVRFTGIDYSFNRKIPCGSVGRVQFVDDSGAVHIYWETGFPKALIPETDSFRPLRFDECYVDF